MTRRLRSVTIVLLSLVFISLNFIPRIPGLSRRSATQKCIDLLLSVDRKRGFRAVPSFEFGIEGVVADWRETLEKLRKSLRVSDELSVYGVSFKELRQCVDVLGVPSLVSR